MNKSCRTPFWSGLTRLRFYLTRPQFIDIEFRPSGRALFSNNFDEHALGPATIKFAVEDLLPRPKIELAFGDRDADFTAHYLPLEMSIGVVLAGAVMLILRSRRVRRELLEPFLVLVMQSAFIVVDES